MVREETWGCADTGVGNAVAVVEGHCCFHQDQESGVWYLAGLPA